MICPRAILARMLFFFLILLLPATSPGAEIPEQLKPWVPWVLHDQQDRLCTSSFDGKRTFCVWPEPLRIELDDSGGQFSQSWDMKRDGWIILPGKEKLWPREVTINGQPARTMNRNGSPAVYIDTEGRYDAAGKFEWKTLPESLPVPEGTAIVQLTVNGKERMADLAGSTLWVSSRSKGQGTEVENSVHTQVYRLISDSIPMVITNRIEVQVSGKAREILLDWLPPADQIPVSLQAALPVKIGTDNRIHMQARPGNHVIVFRTRLQGPVDELAFTQTPIGPDVEYWSFEAHNRLRMVKTGGEPQTVDPTQTTIPGEWHSFPAYRVEKGQTLLFETLKRGNPEPPPNNLTIHRTFWLDSGGAGMTVQDNISGTVHRKPRLEMQEPAELGRMVINGRDQLITRVNEDGPAGVEVRQGRINAMAVSRIEETRTFPAGGWDQSVSKLSGELVLPPGWTVLHVSGADRVKTWISRWTLLDCFIVLIIVITTFKLLGAAKGATALVALLLSYHDPDAPVYLWLALLACIAIIKALPDSAHIGKVKRVKIALLAGLLLMILPYSVEQLRVGFFPQLERVYNPYIAPAEMALDDVAQVDEEISIPEAQSQYMGRAATKLQSALPVPAPGFKKSRQPEQLFDVQSKVQAGPGIPAKKWRVVRLSWNGPVEKELQLNVVLISPLVNLILAVVKVAAVFLLAFFMVDLRRDGDFPLTVKANGSKAASAALLVLLLSTSIPSAHASDYPPPELLAELKERLLEPAECFPHCADLEQMEIEMAGTEITLALSTAAEAESAVMLPFGKGFYWNRISVDTTPSPALADGNQLWLQIPEGHHTIQISGQVNRAELQLQLPIKPHRVVFAETSEWTVTGLDENNVPEGRLQFNRKEEQQKTEGFGSSTLPPMMQVKRILHLGLQWRVETTIARLSPPGSSVFLEIPMLSGESVTNAGFETRNGTVSVRFGPNEMHKSYQSVFTKQDSIELTAPKTTQWHEIWQLDASPVWHVEADGFAPVLHHSKQGAWQPEWHPWPGERLTLSVTRPEGVPGPTKAIESSTLVIKPGLRSTTMQLMFTIRSTRGDQQNITLPENAIVQSVAINGRQQPVKSDNKVVIPLSPSSQKVAIEWRSPQGISTLFTVPEIDLGSSSVNADIEVHVGNRWVWYVRGPQAGPAILFYSELLIIALFSIMLGRSGITPLRSYHWLILGFGLCQSGLVPCLVIVAWFIALKVRREKGESLSAGWFNLMQICLVLLTVATIGALAFAVRNGLLGHPDMLISGNNSGSYLLRWYQDRVIDTILPQPMIVSIPMIAYRITMLTWALWMAFHLLRWVKWGWDCFTRERIWQKTEFRLRKKKGKEPTEE